MARNSEKQYGKLNRLILFKEKEEYEKAHPKRPKLDSLETVEEVQKWLPSIKQDLNFYLKKSQVTCYSESQIEDCSTKVCKLEKEFKAFVRKIRQLTPGTLDVVPWTNRPYKRKSDAPSEVASCKSFVPLPTPILNCDKPREKKFCQNVPDFLMNKPLTFVRNKDEILNSKTASVDNDHVVSFSNNSHSHLEDNNEHFFAEKSLQSSNLKNNKLHNAGKEDDTVKNQNNILGISYDDSSDSDEN